MFTTVTTCLQSVAWTLCPQGYRSASLVWVAPLRWLILGCRSTLWSSVWLLVWLSVSYAQVTTTITSDGALGTKVTPADRVYEITGGRRPSGGANLFHSFDRFTVGTGDTAHFIGESGIDNIIGRVTGPEASMIDGKLKSDASLYLLNPQGMMFGPNATLDINGSFYGSTADVLRFADGAEFSTRLSEKSTLTVAPPAAFGFLNDNPSGIHVQGSTLEVPEGKTLSIVGGDINILGDGDPASGAPNLSAPGGHINLTSTSSSGDVAFDSVSQLSFEQLGDIMISEGALVDVSGEGSGTIAIRGGQLMIDTSWLLADTLGSVNGAEIGIDIVVDHQFVIANKGLITTDTLGAGNAGNIQIASDDLRVESGTIISSSSYSSGKGGEVAVKATKVTLDGTAPDNSVLTAIGASTQGVSENAGDTGAVIIEALNVRLMGRAQISNISVGPGNAGIVMVKAQEVTLEGASPQNPFIPGLVANAQGTGEGAGDAGAIVIEAQNVKLTSGAQITSATFGPGSGGKVMVNAKEVILEGTSPHSNFIPSSIVVDAFVEGDGGEAGAIVIEAEHVRLSDGAHMGSTSFGPRKGGTITVRAKEVMLEGTSPHNNSPTTIVTIAPGQNEGASNAGAIVIEAQNVRLQGGAQIISATFGPGNGGKVIMEAKEVTLEGTSSDNNYPTGIFASAEGQTEGAGAASDIVIEAQDVSLIGGAQILIGTSGPGHGGMVKVKATATLTVAGQDSSILANTTGTGPGGDIVLYGSQLLLTNNATVSAQSLGQGNAGNIQFTATDLILSDHSEVTAASARARGGNINIEAETVSMVDSNMTAAVNHGEEQGGNIRIGAATTTNGEIIEGLDHLSLEGGRIAANTDAGNGANIVIGARKVLLDRDSMITANTNAGVGGNVTMAGSVAADDQPLSRAETVVLRESGITAEAQEGQGGRIHILTDAFLPILADAFLVDPARVINASSQEGGVDGEVNIEAVVNNLNEVTRPLQQRLAADAPLLRDRCAARLHQGLISSFVERERAGIAASPEGLLPARLDTHTAEVISSAGPLLPGIAIADEPTWRLRSRCP